jgi:uncharacterized protein (TIGR03435 family)
VRGTINPQRAEGPTYNLFRKSKILRMFNTTFWRFYLVSLLIIASAQTCTPATAQDSHEANSSTATTKQTKKPITFEVVSIRPLNPDTQRLGAEYMPDGYQITAPLEYLIKLAYIPQTPNKWSSSQILNVPAWASKDWYALDARVAPEDVAAWKQSADIKDYEPLRSALQAALTERCRLALHTTPIEAPYLNLVVDKHGAKLKDTVPGPVEPVKGKSNNRLGKGLYIEDNEERIFVGVSMEEFTMLLMRLAPDYPVKDKTGLTGRYDFTLPWYDYRNYPASEIPNPLDRMPLSSIGLTLKRGTGPAFVLNIDHIEKPTQN